VKSDFLRECGDRALWEVARERGLEIRVIGEIADHDIGVDVELGVSEKHRKLGPRQSLIALGPDAQLRLVRKEFHRAVELSARLELPDEASMRIEIFLRAILGHGKRERLIVVIDQDVARDIVGHLV
jgi:hypothetical protein